MYSAEEVLLPLQRLQLAHDEAAHFDMLSFDLHKRLKHMVLHFLKYAGKIEAAREQNDLSGARRTLLDTFVICMATANALNLSLGSHIATESKAVDLDDLAKALRERVGEGNLFADSIKYLVTIGGRMAKAVESLDHMERGDCRSAMELLVPTLTEKVLGLLGRTSGDLENDLRLRFQEIEKRSIFGRVPTASR